jgi:putative membrane protein
MDGRDDEGMGEERSMEENPSNTGTSGTQDKRSLKDYLSITVRGFFMGAADVVPGVSGGTMAFILGIYEELLDAIHAVNLPLIKLLISFRFKEALAVFPYKFLIALVSGILIAIFSLAQFFKWALQAHPELVWSFFFGLVLASIITVRNRVTLWSLASILFMVLGTVVAYGLVGIVPVETTEAAWFMFLSGAIAICAMILPGISGSFLLVLLGKYSQLLNAVVQRDFVTIIIFACGGIIGLISFARVLRWLFHHYHNLTVAALIGLMIGSLRKVWPWKDTIETYVDRHGEVKPLIQHNILPEAFSGDVVLAIGLGIVGCTLVLVMERLATGRSNER